MSEWIDTHKVQLNQLGTVVLIFAVIFNLTVGFNLLVAYRNMQQVDPLNNPAIEGLVEKLKFSPDDRQLREVVVQLDHAARNAYFLYMERIARGRVMLMAGTAVLAAAAGILLMLRKGQPRPGSGEPESKGLPRMLLNVVAGIVALAVVIMIAAFPDGLEKDLGARQRADEAEQASGVEEPAPEVESAETGGEVERSEQPGAEKTVPQTTVADPVPQSLPPEQVPEPPSAVWRCFRGSDQGVVPAGTYPLTWNAETGQNVIWKQPLPVVGASSTVIWNDKLFTTGGTKDLYVIYCYNRLSGELLWQKEYVPSPAGPELKIWKDVKGMYASATPAVDHARVCAVFANGDLFCLDHDGTELWKTYLGPLDNKYGHSSSLDIYTGRLIVQLDQGGGGEEGEPLTSSLIAFDLRTGTAAWEVDRMNTGSWSSPVIVSINGADRILTGAEIWFSAHDAATGKELWRAESYPGNDTAPLPLYACGYVWAVMEGYGLIAITPGGSGDVTDANIAWEFDEADLPSTCSPVSDGTYIYLASSGGYFSCIDPLAKEMAWELDLEFAMQSSPMIAGEHIYQIGENPEGRGVVLKTGSAGEIVAENFLHEYVQATPAFVDNRIYIRGEKHLFCLGKE